MILKAATSLDGRIAAAPGRRTPLTSRAALRHAHQIRAQVDAIAIGSETLLVDDPLLTAREVYRERALTRIVFDRRLRTQASARLFGTLAAGPVIIVTSPDALRTAGTRADALQRAGATVLVTNGDGLRGALRQIAALDIQSVLLEGGAAVHAAAWDEQVVDFVQLYIAPVSLGQDGVPLLLDRPFMSAALFDRRIDLLGDDVLIEGYVHRPY